MNREERKLQQITAASQRWQETAPARQEVARKLKAGGPVAAETKPRITAFQGREAMRAIIRNTTDKRPAPGFERVIGEDDMLASPPDQQAYNAGLPVARV